MFWIIFQLISFMQMNPDFTKEQVVIEWYVEWAESLEGIRYARWWILNKRYVDCSWLFVRYGIILGLRESRNNLNSYNLYKLGIPKSYKDSERGDFVFFLPIKWNMSNYHIAYVTEGYDGSKVEVTDYITKLKADGVVTRDLNTYRCWSNICYSVNGTTWKLQFSSNGFIAEMKRQGLLTDSEIKLIDGDGNIKTFTDEKEIDEMKELQKRLLKKLLEEWPKSKKEFELIKNMIQMNSWEVVQAMLPSVMAI